MNKTSLYSKKNEFLKHDIKRYNIRIPPHSIEAEQALIGGIIINLKSWNMISNYIHVNDFYRKEHKKIYKVISHLILHEKPIDIITVKEKLERENVISSIGGLNYLIELSKNIPSSANIITYAEIVKEKSLLRKIIMESENIIENAFNSKNKTAKMILDEAEYAIFNMVKKKTKESENPQNINSILNKTINKIEKLYLSPAEIIGLPTGFIDFDKMTNGLQKSDLIIIAGRPSMGKTTFSMNIVENVIADKKKMVLFFSMEMPAESLTIKLLSSISKIKQNDIKTGSISNNDWPRLSSAIEHLSSTKLLIDDTGELSLIDIRSKIRKVIREYGKLNLIVIDYLQLIRILNLNENRTTEVSLISRSLKILAREINIPIIVLSQLNRSLEQRTNKRPYMSDLRESGSIEQDADLIVFIYRDEVYNKEASNKGISEIIIGKQRNGPIGTIKLTFLSELARFENYIKEKSI